MELAVEIKNLQFSYGKSEIILEIPTLEFKSRERIFICGPSGCGKSTLLGLVTGIVTSRPESIKVLDKDLAMLTPAGRDAFRGDHIGYIFQSFNLLPYLSVLENIMLPAGLSSVRRQRAGANQTSLHDTAIKLARNLGIEKLAGRAVTTLSFGQQQRVAAARALFGNPELLVCDEPTSALDKVHRDRFWDVLMDAATSCGTTVLFVSHDMSMSGRFDRTIDLTSVNRAFRASSGDD
jgi:putative ABC transport system ATP-binding protein